VGRAIACLACLFGLIADPIPVRLAEGRVHGFVVLRDLNDNILASGDLTQSAAGTRVTSELSLHFKDGSVHEETTVFTQRHTFQLRAYRLVQKGRSFKRQLDLSLNTSTSEVTVHYTDEDGKEKTETEHMELPRDLANGIFPIILSDIDPKTPKATLTMIVATPKPRVVKLEISPQGEDPFSIAGSPRKALHYTIKMDIGGVKGVIAPIVGKQPPDINVWMIGGKVPGLLKLEGQLYEDGPIWRIELTSPVWPNH
jgi:hypothetical protein